MKLFDICDISYVFMLNLNYQQFQLIIEPESEINVQCV